MTRLLQKLAGDQKATAAGRSTRWAGPLVAALALSWTVPTIVLAEESSLQRFFNDVRRSTRVPDLLRSFTGNSDPDDRPSSQQEETQLRQPPGIQEPDEGLRPNDSDGVWRTTDGDETLPAPRLEGRVPMAGWNAPGDVNITRQRNGNISMVVRDASLSRVLSLVAQTYHLNIVASNDIDAIISITLRDVPLDQALTAILAVANYTWVERNGIILITSLADSAQLPADVQGRQIQVFELDFASASALEEPITGLLSPIGKLAVTEGDPADNRRTQETIVVEDLPDSIARIAAYVEQVDRPPRQVLIEAHILQVTLSDVNRHGVNFNALFRVAGETVNLISVPSVAAGLNAPDPSSIEAPTSLATIQGGDLTAVIELLKSTTDAKTLGSPKLLVLNQQEARIQIGEKIAYATTTTTETSAIGGAAFIETGTILRIRPRITRDNRIVLNVAPEVSEVKGDRPSPDLPPNTSTTELQTDVMLDDGQGMIIGGLIKEIDSTTQSKIPYLGDVWRIGNLFKRSEVTKERTEIIVALVPHIQPYNCEWQNFEQGELARTGTTLFDGPLCRTERPWEPVLPDGTRVAKPLIPPPPTLPYLDRTRDCVAPTPGYAVPHKPFVEQQFCDGGAPSGPCLDESGAPTILQFEEPQIADEFELDFEGGHFSEGTVISDQP